MKAWTTALCIILGSSFVALTQLHAGVSPPENFTLREYWSDHSTYVDTKGLVPLSPEQVAIAPTKKALVDLSFGQSNRAAYNGPLYLPTNQAAISQLNIYDGALYPITGPLLGVSINPALPGSIHVRVADLIISNHKFDRVIVVPGAITNTSISAWAPGGVLEDRMCVAMRRLAALGITPSTPGVTFVMEWSLGPTDALAGTTQAAYTASWNAIVAKLYGCGFVGKIFIAVETYAYGTISLPLQNAQKAAVNGTTVFQSANTDGRGPSDRSDNIHFSPVGPVADDIYAAFEAGGLF